ncbi:MAG TPA: hypothetical protein VM677_21960 [Actinokineospora sp.]|nr:hypothetical protein [Actinokineospora sp.]
MRRLIVGALAAIVVAGGAVGYALTRDTDTGPVPRTDLAPLQARFGALGTLSDAHWLGYNPREDGSRSSLPENDPEIRVVGVARLTPGTVTSIIAAHDFRLAELVGPGFSGLPDEFSRPPASIAAHLPPSARWLSSTAFDEETTGKSYRGRFYLDQATDTVYFDTVNPAKTPS